MHQKIEISNFGPVRTASIEIRPVLILIGTQASGKSTIAKLIYFFQSLSSEFFTRFYNSDRENLNIKEDFLKPIREKFYDFFGSTFHLPDFKITYHYAENRSLTLSLYPDKRLKAETSPKNFFSDKDRKELNGYKKMLLQLKSELNGVENITKKIVLDERQLTYLHYMSDKINSLFCNEHNDSLFILAGRNATIGYSETFENMLRESIQKNIELQGHRAFDAKVQTIDETLMLSFMQRVVKMRQSFISLGNFDGIINHAEGELKHRLELAYQLIQRVLRGKYSNSEYGEIINYSSDGYVFLKNASSGQQESIRILQDAFLSIYQDNKLLRIVEEPEAHLFPEAQMATIQLLVLMLNSAPAGHLILTTHSPYTLTVINNLIYAAKVGAAHADQVYRILPEELWLPTDRVAAYMLKNGIADDIIDPDLGEIKAELIDTVSNLINEQYKELLQHDDNDGTED